jgi:hypothetical protein
LNSSVYIGFRVPKEISDLINKRVEELRLGSRGDYLKYLIIRDLREAGYRDSLNLIKIVFRGDVESEK